MLLTLSASCVRSLLSVGPKASAKKAKLSLLDLPVFARQTLGLSGINLSTDLLVGADRAFLESIRERADRASCSCLLLVENDPQNLGVVDDEKAAVGIERLKRVVQAAQILGCSAAALKVEAQDDDNALNRVSARLKPIMEIAEKIDLNLLISPHTGLTTRPERVTELLKKVGGFRIGTYPDFQTASEQKTPAPYLHRLTPYATVVCASTVKFETKDGKAPPEGYTGPVLHKPYLLEDMIDAISSVGYEGPLSIEYRGPGDPVAGITYSRDLLKDALGESEISEEDLMDEFAEEEPVKGEEEEKTEE
jgi:sugar phosphate isomerase/epimerase